MSRLARRLTSVASVILVGTAVVACGSGSPGRSSSAGRRPGSGSSLSQEGLSFARCMRAHGVSNFPDPSAGGGGFNLGGVAGINPSSPAFKSAQTACKNLEPVKSSPSEPPSAHAFARLLHWAGCMRAHGIAGLPDPKPDPPPSPGAADASRYGTLMGDGGYWVGIPISVNAHSAAFVHLSTACGEAPGGHPA